MSHTDMYQGYQFLLELHDDLSWDPNMPSAGMDMKYFHNDPNDIPSTAQVGDVILIRKFKVRLPIHRQSKY